MAATIAPGATARRNTACDHTATVNGIGTVSAAASDETDGIEAALARAVPGLSAEKCISRASSATKRARSGAGVKPSDRAIATVPPGTGTFSETPSAAARCIWNAATIVKNQRVVVRGIFFYGKELYTWRPRTTRRKTSRFWRDWSRFASVPGCTSVASAL